MAKTKLNELLDWLHEAQPKSIDEVKTKVLAMVYSEKPARKWVIPTMGEVITFFVANGYTEEAGATAFKYYQDGNWHDSKGNKVLNWKQKMRSVWFKEEYKKLIPIRREPQPNDYFEFADYERALNDYIKSCK